MFNPKFSFKEWLTIFALLCALNVSLFFEWQKLPDENYHFSMFQMPLGEGMLIETPHGHKIVIDGGIDSTIVHRLFEHKPFFNRQIDALILTHPDSDHLTGAYYVLENFDIKQIFLTQNSEKESRLFRKFLNLAQEKNSQINYLNNNSNLQVADLYFEILSPTSDISSSKQNKNNSSLVSRLHILNTTFFLGGDIENFQEKRLLQKDYALQSDILKINHHGSKNSSCPKFLAAVNPKIALISADTDNPYGHPHKETLQRLQDLSITHFQTGQYGDLEFIINENSFDFQFTNP